MVVHAIGAVTGSPVLFAALTGGPLAAARTAAGVLAGAAESLAPVPPPQEVLAYTTDPTAVTATQVSEATTRVLETPTYRQAAQRIAAEIAAAPPPSSIGPWLRSLAGDL